METNDLIVVVNRIRLDAGLLILRVGAGLSLLVGFGWPKLEDVVLFAVSGHTWSFADTTRSIGLPAPVIVAGYQTLNESLGAVLVMGGVLSRWASGSLSSGFLAATYVGIEVTEDGAWIIAAAFYCLIFTAGSDADRQDEYCRRAGRLQVAPGGLPHVDDHRHRAIIVQDSGLAFRLALRRGAGS